MSATHLWILDPGTRHAGVALFDAVTARPLDAHSLSTNRSSPREMLDEITIATAGWDRDAAVLVSEWPRKYKTNSRAHEDINGLREVVAFVEDWGGWLRTVRVSPGVWKGQVPKHIHHVRIGASYAPETLARLGWDTLGPDGKDAVGIGQWALGTGARRVFP